MGLRAAPAALLKSSANPFAGAGLLRRLALPVACGSRRGATQPARPSHALDLQAGGGPLLPAGYSAMDVERLELQAEKLRSVVAKRRQSSGFCSNSDADSILAHYEKLIAGLEQQIEQTRKLQTPTI